MQARPSDRFLSALQAWGPTSGIIEPLVGNRNEVWTVWLDERRYAGRLSKRSPESLDWELRLLEHLNASRIRVPIPRPALDGRLQVDGLALLSWLEGEPPASERDWRAVAETLDRLHAATRGWPQRPGFHTIKELVELNASGDARLDRMPPELVARLRERWMALADEPLSVVHGDPGPGNIRVQGGQVGLLDWDEARLDVSLLDLAALVPHLPDSDSERLRLGRRAAMAWEVANAWIVEPAYARRLAQEMGQDEA